MTSALGLTPRQRDALTYLNDYTNARGYPPTYREIAAFLGMKSLSSVAQIIKQLTDRGHIRKGHAKARSIELNTGARDVALGIELEADLCAEARRLEVSPETLIAWAVEVYLREDRA